MTDVHLYPANVFWSDEDEGFIATAPDLSGCSAFGGTKAEAITELEQAIEAWIEAARSAGNPIPQPSRPTVEPQSSGKVLVRMPKVLHASLVKGAKQENVSLNHYVVFLLTAAITHRATGDFLQSLWHQEASEAAWHRLSSFNIVHAEVVSTAHVIIANPPWMVVPVARVVPRHMSLISSRYEGRV